MQKQILKPIFSAIRKFFECKELLQFALFGIFATLGIDKNFKDFQIFLILYLAIVLITLVIKKLMYQKIVFQISEDAINYKKDFISLEQKNVKYTDIKQVELQQNPIQRFYGIGSVLVTTHATTSNAGIELYDIKEYQEVYEFLLKKGY